MCSIDNPVELKDPYMREHHKAYHYSLGNNVVDETIGNPQETVPVTEAEKGWLAGIIDGEGCIVLFFGVRGGNKLNNVTPQVIMGNTDKDLFDKYVDILHRLDVGYYVHTRTPKNINGVTPHKPAKKKYRELYIASVVGFLRTKKLLDLVSHYLTGQKRERARLLLKFVNARLARAKKSSDTPIGRMAPYNLNDLINIKEFCKLMNSKHEHIIDGLLRDYTGSQPQAA